MTAFCALIFFLVAANPTAGTTFPAFSWRLEVPGIIGVRFVEIEATAVVDKDTKTVAFKAFHFLLDYIDYNSSETLIDHKNFVIAMRPKASEFCFLLKQPELSYGATLSTLSKHQEAGEVVYNETSSKMVLEADVEAAPATNQSPAVTMFCQSRKLVQASSYSCTDKRLQWHCQTWAQRGMCAPTNKYGPFMSDNCRHTCGQCASPRFRLLGIDRQIHIVFKNKNSVDNPGKQTYTWLRELLGPKPVIVKESATVDPAAKTVLLDASNFYYVTWYNASTSMHDFKNNVTAFKPKDSEFCFLTTAGRVSFDAVEWILMERQWNYTNYPDMDMKTAKSTPGDSFYKQVALEADLQKQPTPKSSESGPVNDFCGDRKMIKTSVRSAGNQECTDENGCSYWAKQGFCVSHANYMNSNCKQSCGTCGPRLQLWGIRGLVEINFRSWYMNN